MKPLLFAFFLALNFHTAQALENEKSWDDGVKYNIVVKFPACWEQAYANIRFSDGGNFLKLTPTESCPKEQQGKWTISYSPQHTMRAGPWGTNLGPRPTGHEQTSQVKDFSVNFWDKIETFIPKKKKETKTKAEEEFYVLWIARFYCDETIEVRYVRDLSKDEIDKAKNDHQIPEVFKKFISGFECKKRPNY